MRKLYAIYYGVAEPANYGVRTSKLAGSRLPLGEDAIIAVSATYLQGLYLPPQLSAALERVMHFHSNSPVEPA